MTEQQAPTLQILTALRQALINAEVPGAYQHAIVDEFRLLAKNIDTASPSPALRACPNCCAQPSFFKNETFDDGSYVICRACGATSAYGSNYEQCALDWNARQPDPPSGGYRIGALATPQPSPASLQERMKTVLVELFRAQPSGALAFEAHANKILGDNPNWRESGNGELARYFWNAAIKHSQHAPETATPSLPKAPFTRDDYDASPEGRNRYEADLANLIPVPGFRPLYASPSLPAVLTDATCRGALAELVACKELKDAANALNTSGSPSATLSRRHMLEHYERRQPLAWEAARRALATSATPVLP